MFAALIALNGVPVEDAQARRLGSAAPAAAAHAAAPTQATPAPAADHAAPAPAQAAPAQPVEKAAHPTTPAETPHAAPSAQAPAGHAPAAPAPAAEPGHTQPPAHGPPAGGGDHGAAAGSHGAAAGSHGETSLLRALGPYLNFAILLGGLIYFLRAPIAGYLAARSQQIRGGLESARETTDRATARLAELDQRLKSLPGELEALRKKGVEEIATEERRIQAQAEAEKKRLVDDVQRDIDVRVRVARKQLAEHAADLAVGLAADRVRQTITDADQARLIDRYADEVKDIHG